MSSILRKVKSLPALLKRRKSSQKLEKLCNSIPLPYDEPSPRPTNWLFLERCQLLETLADYFIELHEEKKEDREQRGVWYWANDFDEVYPMTYRPNNNSTVSDSLLRGLGLISALTTPLTNDHQTTLALYFKTHQRPRRM